MHVHLCREERDGRGGGGECISDRGSRDLTLDVCSPGCLCYVIYFDSNGGRIRDLSILRGLLHAMCFYSEYYRYLEICLHI